MGVDATSNRPRALISVYDKSGVVEFAQKISDMGWEILSTGGTARLLKEHSIDVVDVTDVTGHPEVFDGRVKTLHPAIHAGILARGSNLADLDTLDSLGYSRIDLVCVNLYPFESVATESPPVEEDVLLEMIDIGGPTLLRAAAKSHQDVLVVPRKKYYREVIDALEEANHNPSGVSMNLRQRMAISAFQRTAAYDVMVATILAERLSVNIESPEGIPAHLLVSGGKANHLRYGENPHQAAGWFDSSSTSIPSTGLSSAVQHGGKELSFNNYLDLDAALRFARSLIGSEWSSLPHTCVIIKHTNACGVASSTDQVSAWKDALASDSESAFGCVIAFTTVVTQLTAEAIGGHFVECIIAPGFEPGAMDYLSQKKNRRLLTLDSFLPLTDEVRYRHLDGVWLAQIEGVPQIDWDEAECVTSIEMESDDRNLARFGVAVCAQVKSNSVVLVDRTPTGFATVGIGPGQTSRVEAVRIAARRAGVRAKGSMMVSDAFFPFRDGIDAANEIGVTSIVQPGGSIRDQESIDAANEYGMSMIFTGMRLFRH
tara:strand:+ start:9300 stop:10928 length:1629 start_codon:yes stop_codon:yes gene_type:complete